MLLKQAMVCTVCPTFPMQDVKNPSAEQSISVTSVQVPTACFWKKHSFFLNRPHSILDFFFFYIAHEFDSGHFIKST